tara:strand:+ start:217 stop:864 length:648 start_codon:yes stop_codon:yes gene_type:complete
MTRNLIKDTAILCKKSYKNNFDVSKNIVIDTESGLQCNFLINDNSNLLYIVFRGSDELKDWFSNILISDIELKDNIKIHKGFYLFLQKNNIIKTIKNIIETIQEKNKYKIIICGHSLGGALSQVLAYELLEYNYNIQLIIFGMLNIGNIEFQKKLNSKYNIIMINYSNDIVFQLLSIIYKKCLFNNIILPNNNKNNGFKNHSIDVYIEYLKKFDI